MSVTLEQPHWQIFQLVYQFLKENYLDGHVLMIGFKVMMIVWKKIPEIFKFHDALMRANFLEIRAREWKSVYLGIIPPILSHNIIILKDNKICIV
jgi:hypothetical protein